MNRTHGFVWRSMSAARFKLESHPPVPLGFDVTCGDRYGFSLGAEGFSSDAKG